MEEERIEGVMFGYVCQICGEYREIILPRHADPVAICPECAKRIRKLIYQEDDLK